MSGSFTLHDVSYAVPGRTLLQGVSLTLPPGRITGLIGHNGSGKSTLLKLLARQLAPSTGEIQLDGRALPHWPSRLFARHVAYMPQQPAPAEGLTVRELTALGRYPWHGALGHFTATDKARTAEAMALTGVDGLADRLVETLSGGERQRAWLAMLVAQDARILLLDEPISALDVRHQIEVMTLIQRLRTEKGLGVAVVLHDVNIAARFCDCILALHDGALVASGTPAEIVIPATLERIYGLNLAVMPHPASGIPLSYLP